MVSGEQQKAWTQLKVHLMETMNLLEKTKDNVGCNDPYVAESLDMTIKDIEENLDIVEQVFIE